MDHTYNITIKPKKIFSFSDIKEIWQHKELLYFFTWRNLKLRYKQTSVGALWVILQPVLTMIVFSIFFGGLLKVPSDGVPYPIFVYTGLLFWQFFSAALSETSNVLIANQSIITKVYFPRLILPLSSVSTKFVDFVVASVVLVGMMIYYEYTPHLIGILILPLLLIITFLASTGLGLFLASINVKYRDVGHILPFFIQLLMFVTPVIYSVSITGKYSWVLALNPMTAVIESARATLFGTSPLNGNLISTSIVITLCLMLLGIYIFKKTERYFADII